MSTNTTPPARESWWVRFKRAVRFVLDLEPVAVQAVVRALLVLVGSVGLVVPEWVEPRVAGAIVAFYALVEVLTTLRARAKVTPSATVVELVTPEQVVVAGPASELPTGQVIRAAGSLTGGAYPTR